MTYKKGWDDQPDIVRTAKPLFKTNFGSMVVELRKEGAKFYVSIGNLFGSQTLFTEDLEMAFKLLEIAKEGKQVGLPEGVTLLA